MNTLLPPFSLLKRDTKAGQGLSFPISPSFVHNYATVKEVKLKQASTFCSEKNIPFSAEEDKFYKLKQAKTKFRQFSKVLNACYETARPNVFDVGISLMEGSESKPPKDMVSKEYTDLRQYMPELSFKQSG